MKWSKFTLTTTTAAVDLVSSLLDEIGIEGIEIEDKIPLTEAETKGMFIDILPDMGPDDGVAKVSFYLEDLSELDRIQKEIDEGLRDLRQFVDVGAGTMERSETEDKDWINNWKQYFKPFVVDDILIKPTWEEIPREHKDKLLIQIDPGTAFGTGQHETTQLCIRQLRKFITPETRLLDVGTGSGILAILSLMFGAKHALGTDLDICAVDAVADNCRANGIDPADFELLIGNIITDKQIQDQVGYECYDIVAANILADVLVPLTPVIVSHLKPGGIYITSGIIDDKEQVVRDAAEAAGLEILEVTYQGEWVSITCRKG